MAFWSGVQNWFRGAFGESDEEKKKRQQQTKQPQPKPTPQPETQPKVKGVNQLFGEKDNNLSLPNKPNLFQVQQPAPKPPVVTQPTQPQPQKQTPKPVVVPPPDAAEIRQKAITYQTPKVQDVNNYYGNDLKVLQDELSKGDKTDYHRLQGIMQSLDNRKKELTEFHKQRGENQSFKSARELAEAVKDTRGDWTNENQKLKEFWDGVSKNEKDDFLQYLAEKQGVRKGSINQADAASVYLKAAGAWRNGTGENNTPDFSKDSENVNAIKERQRIADIGREMREVKLDKIGDGDKAIYEYMNEFARATPERQRDIMNQLESSLERDAPNYTSNEDVRRKYQQTVLLYNTLADSGDQRSDFGTKLANFGEGAGKFGAALIESPKHVVQSADTLRRELFSGGKDKAQEIEEARRSGKIDDAEYNRQMNDYARSLEWVPDESQGTSGRLMTSAGVAADTVATFLPIGSLVKGGKAAWVGDKLIKEGMAQGMSREAAKQFAKSTMSKSLADGGTKSLNRLVAEEAAINAGFSGVGSLREGEFDPTKTAQETLLGAAIGAGSTAAGAGATKLWRNLRGLNKEAPESLEDIGRVTTRLEDDATEAAIRDAERAGADTVATDTPATTVQREQARTANVGDQQDVQTIIRNVEAELNDYLSLNPDLTQEQILAARSAAKERADKLVEQFQANRRAGQEAVDTQATEQATTQAGKEAEVQAAEEARTTATTPAEGENPAQPTGNPEVDANNAYQSSNTRSMDDYLDEQERRLGEAKENPLTRFFRVVKEQLYDPLSTFQKYDAKGAVGDDSIVSLMKRITNPQRAIDVRLKAQVRLPNGYQDSVWNIIKKYGKEDGARAKDFANYRMFKDELWRITKGGQEPALRADPKEMADFVARYEAQYPDAIADNAVLREFALRNLKERADAGVDSQAIYEASARNPYYTPRTRALARNKDLAMTHTGGFSTTSKSTASRTGADVAIAPIDLFRLDARNTEIGILKNKLGGNFYNRALNGDEGFNVDTDPNTAVQHREARGVFDNARQYLNQLRELRDSLRGDKQLTAAELKTVGDKARKLEDQAITKMRESLNKAASNPEDVLHDVAARDPNFETEAAAIKAKYGKDRVVTTENGTTLTPKEKTAQMKQDLADLEAKYPDPNITTRKELLELAQSLDSGRFTASQMAEQATTLRQQIPDLEQRLDALTGQVNQSRQLVREGKEAASQAWEDLQDSTQHREDFSGNTWTFKVDGEAGRGTAPAEIAAEMSKLLEFAKPGSRANLLLRGTQAIGSATKAFWTGAFAPVWQTLNVAKNFGLMLHNGRWFQALSPSAFHGFVEGLVPVRQGTRQFINDLRSKGASYENITQSAAMRNMVADDIAARANIGTYLLRNPVNTFKDLYHATSAAYTHVANAQRNAIAWNAYQRAIKAGVPQDKAMHMAVEEISNVFGDLQRVSELAQAMEPLIPYAGATQAGVRALVNKAKTSPAEFAVKQAATLGGAVALTLYSLRNGSQYYQDQIDKGYTTDLDNNFTIVLPGAKRDEDGNWSGIVKIPVTPDFRPLNSAAWKSAYSIANGQGVDPGMLAGKLFDEFTGQTRESIYDTKVAEKAGTPIAGLFTGSPVFNVGKILSGTNPTTGAPLSDSDLSLQPRTEQAYSSTSDFARNTSQATQGALTPIQVDKLLGQLGSTGRALKEDEPGWGKFFNFNDAVTGGKGMTDKQRDTQQYFDNIDAISREIDPNDKKTLKDFQALHSGKTDEEKANMMNSAVKASQFMQYNGDGTFRTTPLFEAERKLDALQRQQGQPGNPIFDLPARELQKVLMYRSLKAANAAGQNYSKGGESAFTALGLDEQWYQNYRDAEADYYKSLNLSGEDGARKSFSGKQEAQLTDAQRAAQTKYFSLDKDGRRAFLAANQWLKDYWADDNEFTDQERQALGFNSLNGDGAYDGSTNSGYGSNYNPAEHINTLTDLTNFSRDVTGLKPVEAEAMPNIVALFQKLLAGGGGGRTKPRLGAGSSGQ